VKDVRDFRGVLEREGATLVLFVALEPPTREMVRGADSAGFYTNRRTKAHKKRRLTTPSLRFPLLAGGTSRRGFRKTVKLDSVLL